MTTTYTQFSLREVFTELLPGQKYYLQLIVGTTKDGFEYVYSIHTTKIEAETAIAVLRQAEGA